MARLHDKRYCFLLYQTVIMKIMKNLSIKWEAVTKKDIVNGLVWTHKMENKFVKGLLYVLAIKP